MARNGSIRTQSLYSVMQHLRLRLPKFDARIQGARISSASLQVLQRATSRMGREEVTLAFDPELRHDQLQRMLINPQILSRNLEVVDSTIHLRAPKSIQDVAIEMAKEFGPEREGEADFEFLMQELVRLADHELNQKVVAELRIEASHDQVWAVEALMILRKAFPNEVQYHRAYADIAFKLKIFDVAIDGYREVVRLTPADSVVQPAKAQPQPTRKGKKHKVSRGGRKRSRVKNPKLVPVQVKELREAEKLYKRQVDNRQRELQQKLHSFWAKVSASDPAARREFIDLVAQIGPNRFRELYTSLRATPRQRFSKLDQLRDECDVQEGREYLADLFHDLGNEMLGDIVQKLARGRSFKSDPKEKLLISDPSSPGKFINAARAEGLAVLDEYLDKDLIGSIDQAMMQKLFEASNDPRAIHQQAVSIILSKFVWQHKLEADKCFGQYEAQRENGQPLDGSLIDRAVAKLETAVARFRHPALVNNLATMVTMQGQHLFEQGQRVPAKAKFAEALAIDGECILALDRMAKVSMLLDEHVETIEHAQKLLGSIGSSSEISQQRDNLISSSHTYIGIAASQLHVLTHDRSYLTLAREHLEKVMDKSDPMIRYCLTEVYFSLGEFANGFEQLELFMRSEPNLYQMIALSSLIWANLDPADRVPAGLYERFTDHFLNAAGQPMDKANERYITTYAIYLFEYGLRARDDGAIASAVKVLDFFADQSRQGAASYYHAHYALAQLAYYQKDYRRARGELEQVLEAEGEIDLPLYNEEMKSWTALKANAHNLLAHTFRRIATSNGNNKVRTRKLLQTAQRHAEAGLEEFPNEPLLLYNLAQVHQEMKHYSEAERLLDQLHELSPVFINGYLTHLDILLARSQRQPAKLAEARRVAGLLETQVRQIAAATENELSDIELITRSGFFYDLMETYSTYRFEPALDLLRLIMEIDMPFDLRSVFDRTISEIETKGKFTLADEIRALVSQA